MKWIRWCFLEDKLTIGNAGHRLRNGVGVGSRHMAAGKTGRKRILIVDVTFQTKSFAFSERKGPQFKPAFGKIFSDESGPGMDKNATAMLRSNLLQHDSDARLAHLAIPNPEWHWTIVGRRYGEIL